MKRLRCLRSDLKFILSACRNRITEQKTGQIGQKYPLRHEWIASGKQKVTAVKCSLLSLLKVQPGYPLICNMVRTDNVSVQVGPARFDVSVATSACQLFPGNRCGHNRVAKLSAFYKDIAIRIDD